MTPENIKGTTFIRSSPENYANIPRNVVYHQPQSQPQPLPMKNVQVSNLSCESVPKIQYERCVTECKNWETKYN